MKGARFSFRLMAAAMAAILMFSCEPKPEEDDTPFLTVSPETMDFPAAEDIIQPFTVRSSGAWSATPSDEWIHLSVSSGNGNGSVAVSVAANESEEPRTGAITVKGAETVTVRVNQSGSGITYLTPIADAFDGVKRASTTYQLLIYSFADSDGDGIGDFKGIQNRLDYLDGLGATALWLSPAHPASSYHAYDVDDYFAINPLYAVGEKTPEKAEADFKELLNAAHAKGIAIYMDYVLNHSSKNNPWFQEALADPSSPYRDYYFISSNPSADYKNFPMLKGTSYIADEWKQVTSGSPKITISSTTEAITNGNATWNVYMWQDGVGDKSVKFVDKGDGTYYLVMDINGKWGLLVRKYADWSAGSKFGAIGGQTTLQLDTPVDLVAEGSDMWFTGNGRYKIELTNVATETLYYMGCFSDWMPDLNYGDVSQAENNACFKDLAASADKWINMGIDGLRLDAVKHICGGISSYNNNSNQTLLGKWYDHCNATFHAAGHSYDIFMVGEVWDGHSAEKYYYKGINSCFEFEYFGALSKAVNGAGTGFVSSVSGYLKDHTSVRSDAVTSIFMTNHDQNRAAESLGKALDKEKLAAAMMLTSPGKPFIYQGEELGYWGKKDSGDEYVRTPILWDKAGKDCAKKGVNNKVDSKMLTADISVEAQEADAQSLLNVYKAFSRARNTYPALAEGEMTASSYNSGNIVSWYMTASSGKVLVIHNVGASEKEVTVTDDISRPVAVLGSIVVEGNVLKMAPRSSAVLLQ